MVRDDPWRMVITILKVHGYYYFPNNNSINILRHTTKQISIVPFHPGSSAAAGTVAPSFLP